MIEEIKRVSAGTNIGNKVSSKGEMPAPVSPDTEKDLEKYFNLPIFVLLETDSRHLVAA